MLTVAVITMPELLVTRCNQRTVFKAYIQLTELTNLHVSICSPSKKKGEEFAVLPLIVSLGGGWKSVMVCGRMGCSKFYRISIKMLSSTKLIVKREKMRN